jgi:ribosome-binding ATPase YchF (GTP1/OBG family)
MFMRERIRREGSGQGDAKAKEYPVEDGDVMHFLFNV